MGAGVTRGALLTTLSLSFASCLDDATSPGPLTMQLVFTVQPSTAQGNVAIAPAPQVTIVDQSGNTDRNASTAVTLSIGSNPAGATLSGTITVNAVAGVATFPDVRVDRPGTGYTLVARMKEFPGETSQSFDVHLAFAQVSVGILHSCGLTLTGFAYCWGSNDVGQLGDSTRIERPQPGLVAGGLTFTQLSAGGDHTCGLASGGTVYCWGSNFTGQLGDSSIEIRDRPTPIRSASGLIFSQVSAGSFHTCGLTTTNEAYCWGSNVFGALGDGTRNLELAPVPVSGGLHFTQVSAGGVHTCGIAAGNVAYCWGWNGGGQVGDSSTATRLTPTPVYGELAFAEISANPGSDIEGHTCAVTTANVAYCWGTNNNGELGDSTVAGHLFPMVVFGTLQIAYVGAARGYACALTSGQALHCWGTNADGELGDGTTDAHLTPSPVAGSLTFEQVSARFDHACGVTAGHTAYCWGTNDHGQLGDGTTTQRLTPTPVIQ